MNAELDLILNQLSVYSPEFHKLSGIKETFHQAGLGEPDPYLRNLSEQGYVQQIPGTSDIYVLSDKGRELRDSGGFSHKAEHNRELRVAAILTLICIAALTLFILIWVKPML